MSTAKKLTGLNPLAYIGVEPTAPPQVVLENRQPTVNDYADFNLGTFWIISKNEEVWLLVSKINRIAKWILLGGGSGGHIPVAGGGTGVGSFTPNTVVCGGTTSQGDLQNVVGTGTSGQVLTSNGAGALPTFQTGSTGGAIRFLAVVPASNEIFTGVVTPNIHEEAIGSVSAMTEIFDIGNSFFPGSGSGTGASFTAPSAGQYSFKYVVTVEKVTGIDTFFALISTIMKAQGTAYWTGPFQSPDFANTPPGAATNNLLIVLNLNAADIITFFIRVNGGSIFVQRTIILGINSTSIGSETAARSWICGHKLN